MNTLRNCASMAAALLLAACATTPSTSGTRMFSQHARSDHRGQDDLLTAGLGLSGLRAMVLPYTSP